MGASAGSVPVSLLLAGTASALALIAGWASRDEHYLSAEFGPGYALGIAGLAMMALLLLYSARKRLRFMASWGATRRWFHTHMALGLLGPTAVLLHCNFELGSINSTVVLACTLFVAGSGIVGRVVYTRIHEELTGRRQRLPELRARLDEVRVGLGERGITPEVRAILDDVERHVSRSPGGPLEALGRFLTIGAKVRGAARACRRATAPSRGGGAAVPELIDAYLGTVRRVARFGVYERVFSLWHALHIPLCLLLFASAGIHVFAVHSY